MFYSFAVTSASFFATETSIYSSDISFHAQHSNHPSPAFLVEESLHSSFGSVLQDERLDHLANFNSFVSIFVLFAHTNKHIFLEVRPASQIIEGLALSVHCYFEFAMLDRIFYRIFAQFSSILELQLNILVIIVAFLRELLLLSRVF